MTKTNDKESPEISERQKILAANLAVVDQWISGLRDPMIGDLSSSFRQAMARAACLEDLAATTPYNAAYNSFIYPPLPGQAGFSNSIVYGAESLTSPAKLFAARIHEYIHAMQYEYAAALHADPFNAASDIILSPEDYVLRKIRLEQDAYVKGAWLCSLVVRDHPDVAETMKGCPLPVGDFMRTRDNEMNLRRAFNAAAEAAKNREAPWFKGSEASFPAIDAWAENAIAEYESIIKTRMTEKKPLTFVRLDKRDIQEIGFSFGPNTFLLHASPAETDKLSAATAKRIADLNKKLGIVSRKELPTLDNALKQAGTHRKAFIARSKAHKGT